MLKQPKFFNSMVPIVSNWLPTLENANIASTEDANGGQTIGGFIACSAINPSNWTRSYSKSAYIDPLPPRSNLHILVNTTVTRIMFSDTLNNGNLVATGVEFATSSTAPKSTVSVNKEAILSSGVVGSAQILQLSGIGPADVLQAAGVTMNFELPGVGQHIQDHLVRRISTPKSLYTNIPSGCWYILADQPGYTRNNTSLRFCFICTHFLINLKS